MRCSTAAGLASALVLVTMSTAAPSANAESTPVSSKQVASTACAGTLYLSVKGSGEKGPEGAILPAFRTAITSQIPGTVTSMYLDYPAISTQVLSQKDLEDYLLDDRPLNSSFFASVSAGAAELTRVLDHVHTACPAQKVVVVGFSQGSDVVTAVLAKAPQAQWITASLLIGNPSHYPGQAIRERDGQVDTPAFGMQSLLDYLHQRQATRSSDRRGRLDQVLRDVFSLHSGQVDNAAIENAMSGTASYLPATDYARTFSLCAQGDAVCDFAPAMSRLLSSSSSLDDEINRARPVHGGYRPEDATRTIDTLLQVVDPTRRSAATPGNPTIPLESPSASPTPAPAKEPVIRVTSPAASAGTSWRTAGALAVATLLLGAVGGWLLGRRR